MTLDLISHSHVVHIEDNSLLGGHLSLFSRYVDCLILADIQVLYKTTRTREFHSK